MATATATRPLFAALDEIPLRTRMVNPADCHPAARPLLAFLNNSRRSVGETVTIVHGWVRPRDVTEDDFAAAQVHLLTLILLANQRDVLAALHGVDKYGSVGEVLNGDQMWHATLDTYAPPEIVADDAVTEEGDPEVEYDAAQTVAVILLTTERD